MSTLFGDSGMGVAASHDGTAPWGKFSYADPHQTISLRSIPTNLKYIFRLCRHYYYTDSLLSAIVQKMAEYPITQLIISEKSGNPLSPEMREKWDYLLNVGLNLRQMMIDINVDKMVYGNSFHYMYYPFVRYCTCKTCNYRAPISSFERLQVKPLSSDDKFTFNIVAKCPKCRTSREFTVEDRKSESRINTRFVRLSPTRMQLSYNPSSGSRIWYWQPPTRIRDGFINGDRTITDSTEMAVLEAAFKDRRIKMNPNRLWVSQAQQHPDLWDGWGAPPIFPVLQDVYYYKVLRRSNEALAFEHIVPARFISPAGTQDVSPQRTLNMSDWQTKLKNEMYRFKQDPNHIIVTPIPISVEQMGGNGRVMMVAPEIEAAARVIAAGIGCPIELIWGGLNWSGASVSLRVLENHFINMREDCERLLHHFVPKLANYFNLTPCNVKLAEFKMADDIQQQTNAVNLMLQGFLSRDSVIGEMGYDENEEFEKLGAEHEKLNLITSKDNIAAAHMNTVIQALEAKASVLLQYELNNLQLQLQIQDERDKLQALNAHVRDLHSKGYATPLEFDQSAKIIQGMDPKIQSLILSSWQQTMPNVVMLLQQKLQMGDMASSVQTQATSNLQGAQNTSNNLQPAKGGYSEGGEAPELITPPQQQPAKLPPRGQGAGI